MEQDLVHHPYSSSQGPGLLEIYRIDLHPLKKHQFKFFVGPFKVPDPMQLVPSPTSCCRFTALPGGWNIGVLQHPRGLKPIPIAAILGNSIGEGFSNRTGRWPMRIRLRSHITILKVASAIKVQTSSKVRRIWTYIYSFVVLIIPFWCPLLSTVGKNQVYNLSPI